MNCVQFLRLRKYIKRKIIFISKIKRKSENQMTDQSIIYQNVGIASKATEVKIHSNTTILQNIKNFVKEKHGNKKKKKKKC